MTPMFTLLIPGDPVAKGRPRVYQGHAITPRRTVAAENRIYTEFRTRYPDATPLDGPLRLEAEFWMSRRGKPDVDNLLKTVLDALNGVAYKDDQQVESLHGVKRTPDQLAPATRGGWRKRRSGDPYTYRGVEYTPHLYVAVTQLPEWNPTK